MSQEIFQDYDHASCFVLVCGVKGTGKTTFWLKTVKREQAWMKFVYDHQDGEFAHKLKVPAVDNPDDLREKIGKGGYIVFDYRRMFPGKKAEGFDWFCEIVFASAGAVGGRKILACDELQKLVDQRNIPSGFQQICDEGRRRKLDVFAICHGVNELHNTIRNECTKCYTFLQTDEVAMEYFKRNGIDTEKIKALKHGEWVCRANTGEVTQGGTAFQPKPA